MRCSARTSRRRCASSRSGARGAGIVELVRAVSGLETDEAGLELGEVTLDEMLDDLLHGGEDRHFHPLPTPTAMTYPLFPFQERGHGWLRMLGDLRLGGILADDMGLGKTVQAIAMLLSEREEAGADAFGPTLVVCPMSVARQWVAEIEKFAPSLRVHLHHGSERLSGAVARRGARESDVVVTSYDIATRDVEDLCTVAWDRLLLDEAQDVKNPATKRARALRLLPARRRLAMTGTPIENRLQELWALMDIVNPGLVGSREWFERTFAGADRAVQRRARARAAEVDGAAVHPAAAEGRGRGGARAAADHGGEGLLQADGRAGEPVSRDGRPVDAADRAAREHVQPARCGACDARAAEAGVQPPGDGAARGRRARGPERQARAADRAAEGGAGRRQVAGVHAVPGLRGARAASRAAAREEGRVLPRAADGAAARRVARCRSRRRRVRACW